MIDLVHPSLYCYVKGMTVVKDALSADAREISPTSTSTPLAASTSTSTSTSTSAAATLSTSTSTPPSLPSLPSLPTSSPVTDAIFQWLPSEFKIDDSGDEVVSQ